jgi:hypothetical protein
LEVAMKLSHIHILLLGTSFPAFGSPSDAQGGPKLEKANAAVVGAFETHDIVMVGEFHGNKQEYAWLRSLVATPAFADRVDDIVMEMGNSLFQKSVDRYISGEDVPLEQVQKAWLNTVGVVGPPSPVTASVYEAVREDNLKRRGKHQMRIRCGDHNARHVAAFRFNVLVHRRRLDVVLTVPGHPGIGVTAI